jgi:hypothetical protein
MAIYNKLSYHMRRNILAPEQFGFTQGISADNFAHKCYPKYAYCGEICYLTEALNCVNHNILIAKLHYYGIQGIVGNSFRF